MTKKQAVEVLEKIAASEGVPLMRLDIMQVEEVINILIDDINAEDDGK